ncbi:hypothetical protein M9Y10_007049 [Tritrichomonas musculus]|uniref:Uncharacterized protein n=1 Tax=Tritrichomonas musculus TaxID=1915356 RepID=A0ABR2J0J2_9EUKA
MFAFLFLLMNYCKKRNLPPEEKRACELLRHNWAYHRSNHDSWTDYLNEKIEYNEKLNGETGNKFSNEQEGNFIDIMLANEFDYYFKLLDSDVPGKLSFETTIIELLLIVILISAILICRLLRKQKRD